MRWTSGAAGAALAALALAACGSGETESEPAPAAPGPAAGSPAAGAPEKADSRCTRIVIDPGHDRRGNSGREPIGPGSSRRKVKDGGGTTGVVTGTPEGLVNLQISRRLRRLLVRDGYCVTMTRNRQRGRSMGNIRRARIANKVRAALFVRIHADGSADRSRNGSRVLYPARRRGWTDDILPASRIAARKLQRALVASLGSRDLGVVPRRDITGFNWANVPAVLPEIGFLSNPREDRLLNRPRYQRRAAEGLRDGIRAFVPPET